MDFIYNTASDSSGSNRNIYEVFGDRNGGRNWNGQSGGKATKHGGRGGGVRGRGVKWKWLQEEVDAYTNLTEQLYSNERYEKFSTVEHQ